MELSEALIAYIKQEVAGLTYGKVIIEVCSTSKTLDIITENRQRFNKE